MNWQTRNLGELVDFRNGVNFSREQEGTGIPILKVKDFGALHHVPLGELDELDPARIKVSAHQFLKPKDIVIIRSNGNRELVGRSMIYNGEPEQVTFSGFCIRARALGDEAVPEFIHYWLRSPLTRATFAREGNGTGINNLSQGFLSSQKIQLPDPDEQSQIVRVLGALDDKIELNRRMNETLEEMARSLFRDWFVEFGPTRRQMEGATDPAAIMGHAFPPEKATTLAPLFPAKLGEDGLPEGWVSRALGDTVTVKRGGSPRPIKDFIRPSGIPWVKIADATRCDGPNLFVTREFIKEEGLKKTVELQPGSLILSNSATPGLPKFLRLRACIHDGWLYFPDTGGLSNEFLYLAFLHFKEAIVSQATGSVFNNLKTDVLKRQMFVFPPDQVLAVFDGVVGPLFEKILANEQENQTLAALRDLLLPKLMSGEIRLKDAEKGL